MSREELERFLTQEGRAAAERLLAESEHEEDFDVAEALDQNLYDALVHYDERASLSRWLSLRFTGPRTEGRMSEEAVEDILGAFRREIVGANPVKNPDVLKLDIVGFSGGSVILHLAPFEPTDVGPGEDDSAYTQLRLGPDAEDQLDHALSVVTDLHKAAESEGDVQQFSGRETLLKGFAALADALDKSDLDMGITWRGRTGRRRTAELTSRGRTYARRYFERADTSEIVTVTGRVVELNISGSFDIKTGTASNSPRYKIVTSGEDSLLGLRLELGQTVRVRTRKHVDRNKFDVTFGVRYEYLDMIVGDEPLTAVSDRDQRALDRPAE